MRNPVTKAKVSRKKNPEKLRLCQTINVKEKQKTVDFDKDVSKTLSLREKQMNEIRKALKQFEEISKSIFRIILVTGSSGIGKTTVIQQIINDSHASCLKFSANIFSNLKELNKQIDQRSQSHSIQTNSQYNAVIIVVEQIEILLNSNKNDEQLEKFMKIFQKDNYNSLRKPILLATSNTINISEKIQQKTSIGTKNGIKEIIFRPYEVEQFIEIIKSKIQWLKQNKQIQITASNKIIAYIAQKCSEYRKGDARTIIQVLKNLFKKELQIQAKQGDQKIKSQLSIQKVQLIFSAFFNHKQFSLESLPMKWQLVLISLYAYLKKTDGICIPYESVRQSGQYICDGLKINYNHKDFDESLEELQSYGIISIRKRVNKKQKNIFLKVGLQQIQSNYHENTLFSKFINKNNK